MEATLELNTQSVTGQNFSTIEKNHKIIKDFIDGLNKVGEIEDAIKYYQCTSGRLANDLFEEIQKLNPPEELTKEMFHVYLNRYKDEKLLS